MNLFQTIILLSLIGNSVLGLFVLLSNSKRKVNIAFFGLTFWIMLWLGAMLLSTVQQSYSALMFMVRSTSALAGLVPIGVFMLHLAIVEPDITARQIMFRQRYWHIACLGLFAVCYSPFFITASTFPSEEYSVPVSEYGGGLVFYLAFFSAVVVAMAVAFWKSSRRSTGASRVEDQFLQLGCVLSFSSGLALYGASILADLQEISRFLPLSVLVWNVFVAYGIATRRILAASAVLQRVLSYGLMAAYLIVLYWVAAWLGRILFNHVVPDPVYAAHLLAALVVAFSVVPAHGWMQALSLRLFFPADMLDVNVLLTQAGAIFQAVDTEANLMVNFSELASRVFGAPDVRMLRPAADGGMVQMHPESGGTPPVRLAANSAIVQLLRRDHEALTVETLERMWASPLVVAARAGMKAAGMALAIGSFTHNELKAVLLFAPRKSGRIYDLRDQQALQILCDQFAVALENANLYTAVQNGKIYNDILLDSLTSGIVAVNSDRIITVFNLCAQQLTGFSEVAMVGRTLDALPPVLAQALKEILSGHTGFRDRDLMIPRGNERISARVSGSLFHGHTGAPLGALLVINDISLLKTMEEQIRRKDRLSSIGTLSAGMAHEIKNPLVTIKTFTQLLPQQHGNAEFRQTFFDLVGQEVQRIDTIVNRLLNFARPALPALKPTSLHGILENSLRLVEQQLYQKEITLVRRLDARVDRIAADSEQLNQTFINLFLNAIQAMGRQGTLAVRTAVIPHCPELAGAPDLPDGDFIQVDVADSGCGIPADCLGRIFDPFYTTKEAGVGLGLSVSHGIIREHGGTIQVESEPGQGSIFHIRLPLADSLTEPAT